MSERPISPLRQRMLEDMAVRKFGEKTRRDDIRHVEAFASFLGRSPDTATADDVRRYQVHLTDSGAQPPKFNSSASALGFFFGITPDRPELAHRLARVHYPRKLPRVLGAQEVGRLLEAAPGPGLKYKAALSVAYGAGLRAAEVVMLRVSDIASKRMVIRVEPGKGGKDRHVMLSPQLLKLLRAWWLQCRSQGWLFPGPDPLLPLSARQLNRVSGTRPSGSTRHDGATLQLPQCRASLELVIGRLRRRLSDAVRLPADRASITCRSNAAIPPPPAASPHRQSTDPAHRRSSRPAHRPATPKSP
jgi:integrase